MRRPREISLENKIEVLRARLGSLSRSADESETIVDLQDRIAEIEDAINEESALIRRVTNLENVIERWRSRFQGATIVIGGSLAVLTGALFLEPVRGSIFSSLFPIEKRFGDVASLMRAPREGLQEPVQLEEFRSNLTEAVFQRTEAEAGIMAALAKYAEAAVADRPGESEGERVALALYKVAVSEHLFDYLDLSRRSLVVSMFTRPSEHSREELIEATLSAGSEPFVAKIEGIGDPKSGYKCGGAFSHNDLAVEIALRPDIYDEYEQSRTLQFLNCLNGGLPRIIISISTGRSQIQQVSVRGVVRGVYDKDFGNPVYTVRATDTVMSSLGLSRNLEQVELGAFFIQDAQFDGARVASRN